MGTKTITMKEIAKKLVVSYQLGSEVYYQMSLQFARGLFLDNISEFEDVLKAEFEAVGIK